VVVFLMFFLFAPVVWMNIVPCFASGHGYTSLSFYFFNHGEIYLNGQFSWATPVGFCL
jgi:hypothetical protein